MTADFRFRHRLPALAQVPWLRWLILASMSLLVLVTTSSDATAAGPPLYPDLRTMPPSDLRFDIVTVDSPGAPQQRKVLRFSNTVANVGQGPLELYGTLQTGSTGKYVKVEQRIYDRDGLLSTTKDVGTFEYHEAHAHWHFADFASYQLYAASGTTLGQPLLEKKGTKTGFCLLDTTRIQRLADSPRLGVYTQCGTLSDASPTLTQGISVGWGDTYRASLAEQWVDLGPADGTAYLADGDYAIWSKVDPTTKLAEGGNSLTNNIATTFFRVQGGRIKILR